PAPWRLMYESYRPRPNRPVIRRWSGIVELGLVELGASAAGGGRCHLGRAVGDVGRRSGGIGCRLRLAGRRRGRGVIPGASRLVPGGAHGLVGSRRSAVDVDVAVDGVAELAVHEIAEPEDRDGTEGEPLDGVGEEWAAVVPLGQRDRVDHAG